MNTSLWTATTDAHSHQPLTEDIVADHLVIGAGIAGLTTAYLLLKAGYKVTIIDSGEIAEGASSGNTGKVTAQHDAIYTKLKNTHTLEYAKNYFDLNTKALKFMEQTAREASIDCGFESVSTYIFTEVEENIPALKEEYEICRSIGADCAYHQGLSLPLDVKGAVSFGGQAQFHPKKYLNGLALLVKTMGGVFYNHTRAVDIIDHDAITVTTEAGYSIVANKVYLCCHFPFYDALGLYFMKVRADRSYIVAGKYKKDFPSGAYINIDDPDRSFRLYQSEQERLLLICGGNHKVGQGTEDAYRELKDYGYDTFGLQDFPYQWSAQDYITSDGLPLIGYIREDAKTIFVATGFGKWGMTWGTAAGFVLTELALEGRSVYEAMLSPSRMSTVMNTAFIKENSNVAYEYIAGKLAPTSHTLPEKNDTASIVTLDGKKYGCYQDKSGQLFQVDITCTHLGCELGWNDNEKSWDCPCHGSRFDYTGKVLEGPAVYPLHKYGEGDNPIEPHCMPK